MAKKTKYWFDTEFIEQERSIDLISIGIVSEEGETYYAISNEFTYTNISSWLQQNVLPYLEDRSRWKSIKQIKKEIIDFIDKKNPEFWVYNGAYDWVIFCQLFGGMRNLPKGYPWYANDIKQLSYMLGNPSLPVSLKNKHHALEDAKWINLAYESLVKYAKLKEKSIDL